MKRNLLAVMAVAVILGQFALILYYLSDSEAPDAVQPTSAAPSLSSSLLDHFIPIEPPDASFSNITISPSALKSLASQEDTSPSPPTFPAITFPSEFQAPFSFEDYATAWNYSDDDVDVHGYFRSDGTYVAPYSRTKPDGIPYNNYGYPGNFNPNTGELS